MENTNQVQGGQIREGATRSIKAENSDDINLVINKMGLPLTVRIWMWWALKVIHIPVVHLRAERVSEDKMKLQGMMFVFDQEWDREIVEEARKRDAMENNNHIEPDHGDVGAEV